VKPRRHAGDAREAAHLRSLNLERVLTAAIEHEGAFTRAELITETGLSAPTVGSLASHLIRSGLLTDLGAGPSRGGRRPAHMEFNARHGVVAGIDLGPTRTHIGVADLRGDLIGTRILSTPQDYEEPEALLSALVDDLFLLMAELNIPRSKLLAVGAGAPGTVDLGRRGMVVALAQNLKGWSQVPMGSILRNVLGLPVVVENDVNLAVLGEHWKGAARGHDSCAFLLFGTGIGAGIMVNGELHHGHRFLAGEIGLMCMGPQYVDTDFGSRGCLESMAGIAALKKRWQPPAAADSSDWVAAVFKAAESGDGAACATVSDATTFLGMATANVCSVLDPSVIVLGGALIAQSPSLVVRVRKIVNQIIPTPPSIVASMLDKDAPLWGSLLLATNEARERLRERLRRRAAR
jgi:glucokinase